MSDETATSSLGHMPGPRWEFDEGVTQVFEDMLRRSIPQIGVMRELVTELATHYTQPGSAIVDLGASRGDAIVPMLDSPAFTANIFELVEVSKPMADVCRARFADRLHEGFVPGHGAVRVHETDLRHGYPELCMSASVTLSVLSLQFTPIQHRQRILRDAWRRTLSGGAFILVEKVLGSDAEADEVLVELYHRQKERNGYSREEIDRKAAALEGVLVPVTARWNEELLRAAGFATVECFWRCLNFCGWIAVRT